jgi:regulatory protein
MDADKSALPCGEGPYCRRMPTITDVRWRGEARRRARIYLDGEWWMTLASELVEEFGIVPGLALSEDEVTALRERILEERAFRFLVRSLAVRQQTQAELTRKLAARKIPDEIGARALGRLGAYGYLDDRETGRQLAEGLLRRGYGRARALRKLREKGLPRELAEEIVEQALPAESELEAASCALLSRQLDGSRESARKAIDFLRRRGFPYHVAERAVRARLEQLAHEIPEEQEP